MASKPLLLEKNFRSGLEAEIAEQLDDAGIDYAFEGEKIAYVVPQRHAKYLPDFTIQNGDRKIIIEGKGRFTSHMTRCPRCKHIFPVGNGAEVRQKMSLIKEQHPELDIRFIFSRSSSPIYPKSPTSYAKWCDDHGFKHATKSIPKDWITELKG